MKVAIVHPWFPQYRLRFFELLQSRAAEEGIDLHIYHGSPPPEWSNRRDTVTSHFTEELTSRFIPFLGQNLIKKDLTSLYAEEPFDLVIVEHAVRNLETYILLARYRKRRLAYWGHGRTYTKKIPRAQEALKYWLARRGSWFFGYTSGGVESVIANGVHHDRTTVLNNSFDTRSLTKMISAVTPAEVEDFSQQYDLHGKTAVFIGGLDDSKRLPFLLEAADGAHSSDSEFRLLVCGAGEELDFLNQQAETRPWLSLLGPLFEKEKAVVLASSQVLAMPGRVGLIALDSFAAGKPIVTTDWPWHAPEFEYLSDGENAVVTADDISSFTSGLIEVLADDELLGHLSNGAREAASQYSVEAMVENFIEGLIGWRDTSHI